MLRFLGRAELHVSRAILDGEIVVLDADGRSNFNDLLFRRGEARFYAFDLLWRDGEDLRFLPLPDRIQRLRQCLPKRSSRVLYCHHIDERGEELFKLACERDLEGIVAKHKFSPYSTAEGTSWVKIKNPAYSQVLGRDELFDRMAGKEPPERTRRLKLWSRFCDAGRQARCRSKLNHAAVFDSATSQSGGWRKHGNW